MILSKINTESLNNIKSGNNNSIVNIEEEFLIENIPPALAAAYKNNAIYLGDKWQSHDKAFIQREIQPNHEEIAAGAAGLRRFAKWDYGKANYEEITAEEAIQYLGLSASEDGRWKCANKASFAQKIQNLRFIYNGGLMEWESRVSGQSIAALYSIQIPNAVLRDNGIDLRNTQGRSVNDTKYIKQYKELVGVIYLCDKIYKTDEYDYPISSEKIADRESKSKLLKVRRKMNTSDANYNAHRKGDAFGGREYLPSSDLRSGNEFSPLKDNTFDRYTVADTGSHAINKRFTANKQDDALINYNISLSYKKDLFKFYDDLRKYLRRLESDLAKHSEEDPEYEQIKEIITHYKTEKERVYKKYLNACEDTAKHKSKVLFTIDKGTADFNKRMGNFYDELQKLEVEYLNLNKKMAEVASFEIVHDPDHFSKDDLQYMKDRHREKLNELHAKISDIMSAFKDDLARSREAQGNIEDATENIASTLSKEGEVDAEIINLFSEWSEFQTKGAENHFKVIEKIKQQLKTLSQELDDHLHIRTRIKKEKQDALKKSNVRGNELDTSLKDIVQFV